MSSLIRTERRGNVALIIMSNEPLNVLSAQMRTELLEALVGARKDNEVEGILIAGQGRCFCAGADISEFLQPDDQLFSADCDPRAITTLLEEADVPVLAAIHGSALGGGLELALACHHRVATPGAELGLPEINLGVLPGNGGTQRLPRLVGLEQAYQMLVSGRSVDAGRAHQIGLLDALIDGDLIEGALEYLETRIACDEPIRKTRERQIAGIEGAASLFARAREEVATLRAKAPAAAAIIGCLESALERPFEDGIDFERQQFVACNATLEAKALQHGFFARRQATKIPQIAPGTVSRKVASVGVVGGGTMGRGIAMAFMNAGFPVLLVEVDADRGHLAVDAIRDQYHHAAASGRMSSDEALSRAALLTVVDALDAIRDCDLVIEAVFEDMAVKKDLCEALGNVCKPDAIIATNTSTLNVDALARASGRPADFVGLHFFSPANVMRLLEIVRGEHTAGDVLATAVGIARKLRKDPVVCGVCYGFIGNRMLEPYLREVEFLLLEGATPRQIDSALEAFGMAMGPCRMMDLAGVDVVAKVVIEREKEGHLPADPRYRIVSRAMFDAGRHGQKASKGFYAYEGRRALDDEDAIRIVRTLAAEHALHARSDISANEIVERCIAPLINEGFKIVEEGIAYRKSDVDVVWLAGYGFPAELGGPMFYADSVGADWLRERIDYYGTASGDAHGYWVPAVSLVASKEARPAVNPIGVN